MNLQAQAKHCVILRTLLVSNNKIWQWGHQKSGQYITLKLQKLRIKVLETFSHQTNLVWDCGHGIQMGLVQSRCNGGQECVVCYHFRHLRCSQVQKSNCTSSLLFLSSRVESFSRESAQSFWPKQWRKLSGWQVGSWKSRSSRRVSEARRFTPSVVVGAKTGVGRVWKGHGEGCLASKRFWQTVRWLRRGRHGV